jgi:hypothetical protein
LLRMLFESIMGQFMPKADVADVVEALKKPSAYLIRGCCLDFTLKIVLPVPRKALDLV